MPENSEDTARARRQGVPGLRLAEDTPGRPTAPSALREPAEAGLPRDRNQAILEAAEQVGVVLKQGGHRFALAGSVAVYAHGGTGNLQHDVDFCVRPEDAVEVEETLRAAGLPVRHPPEDWLIKATCFGQDVDVIFELAHRRVTTEMLDRAEELPVESVRMPVLAPTDLLWSLIAAFSEHHCDFGAVLPIARVLREKVDWDRVRRDCGDEPMPAAFFCRWSPSSAITTITTTARTRCRTCCGTPVPRCWRARGRCCGAVTPAWGSPGPRGSGAASPGGRPGSSASR
ncbi:nucleotidyltransferase family protein [Streptomyces thermospinosisporus]|uniref:Nucleotidyltransferase family protein n=1 Tax=Streptomyces thermospinosisporus TaxID=161482 RepID=A0ABP4JGW1_9ACTN